MSSNDRPVQAIRIKVRLQGILGDIWRRDMNFSVKGIVDADVLTFVLLSGN